MPEIWKSPTQKEVVNMRMTLEQQLQDAEDELEGICESIEELEHDKAKILAEIEVIKRTIEMDMVLVQTFSVGNIRIVTQGLIEYHEIFGNKMENHEALITAKLNLQNRNEYVLENVLNSLIADYGYLNYEGKWIPSTR